MNWTEVNIFTTTEGIDIVCAGLMDIGVKGFAIKDANDFNEFLQNKEGNWDYLEDDLMQLAECETTITIYIPENSQGSEMLISVNAMLKDMKEKDTENIYGRLCTEMSNVKEEDWANNWKQYFKPMVVGEKLLVKPSWEEAESDGRVVLEIDPASSFGSGQHHTTKLCLEFIDKLELENKRVLDLGCGSGILSIAAMLLGAQSAVAVDIEENAAKTAMENAQKNNISADVYKAYCGNIINDTSLVEKIGDNYDIITANIVADILIAMKELFYKFLKPGGILIISGIIDERKEEVTDAVTSAGFEIKEFCEQSDWAAVMLVKK
ncbi:MAG: 50S ribosomal protein L11 methyltransferase [Oscillospiraceae bacterium]|nr:50S ribosomal protein L11 methyltransferase [Ruminococcus sp.]MBP1564171.1 50S ribosomal protein L11 methyltransferase [Oscillospiraceae bacterium]MBQ9981546.1 50S ribosomal protein L11 methyltransferase [Oscillospiraceae bacterium]